MAVQETFYPVASCASNAGLQGAMSGNSSQKCKSMDSSTNSTLAMKTYLLKSMRLANCDYCYCHTRRQEEKPMEAEPTGLIGTSALRSSLTTFPHTWNGHQQYFAEPGKAESPLPSSVAAKENLIWELEAPSAISHQGFYFAISGTSKNFDQVDTHRMSNYGYFYCATCFFPSNQYHLHNVEKRLLPNLRI